MSAIRITCRDVIKKDKAAVCTVYAITTEEATITRRAVELEARKMMCGGPSAIREASEKTQKVCDEVRTELEGKVGNAFSHYKATHERTQVVAGTNYFIKLQVGEEEFLHVRIYKPLPGQGDLSVHSYQLGKASADELAYF